MKFVMIGDSAVGKTSLLLQYFENRYDEKYFSTIGVDYFSKEVVIDNKKQKIQMWDTAGQERFFSITQNYIKGANGIFLVYDITSKKSFDSLMKWKSIIVKYALKDIKMMIIGNKCDETDSREITYEQGEQFSKENNCEFDETSVKDNKNIDLVFEKLFKLVYEENKAKIDNSISQSNKSIKSKIRIPQQNHQCTQCC